ncbi:MAG: pyridoxal phosphate-dependent aminotransferase [Lentisphaeria bacterium]|nr:pyridoxal phosphate-dependent aminotransferase [Lentisphaeria bacterium]
MQLVSDKILEAQKGSSWIRRMFEAGIELKKQYGADNVYDFSLGSPDLNPPAAVIRTLQELPAQVDVPAGLGYMPNAGYPAAREALAKWSSQEQGVEIPASNIVITVGAAGGLNCLFKAALLPGDEVICPAPYFVEYGAYCGNFGGVLKAVPSAPGTFKLNIEGIAAAITDRTRVLLINSPNNPAGVVYTVDELKELAQILRDARKGSDRPIILVADEPYRFLSFDGKTVPSVLPYYEYSVVCSSFSKNLGLAGERVGYLAVNPAMGKDEAAQLVAGLILTNRTIGYVNAPCIGQKLIIGAVADMENTLKMQNSQLAVYAERRQVMASILNDAGIEFQMPAGTFYFFPKAPEGMGDVEFVAKLAEHRILAVPGSGFGYAGYFRLALCVDKAIIERSRQGFIDAMK